jgi:hypothetical protein
MVSVVHAFLSFFGAIIKLNLRANSLNIEYLSPIFLLFPKEAKGKGFEGTSEAAMKYQTSQRVRNYMPHLL